MKIAVNSQNNLGRVWPKPNRHRDAVPTAFTITATSVAKAATSVANAAISSAAVTSVTLTTAFDRVPHGLLVVEGDEAEAPEPLGLTVVDDIRFDDLTEWRKGLRNASLLVEERVGLMDQDPSPPPEL
ncbi:unnamed protein product [Prunus armeniaca]|uniref:Uncharacterized protein n=1 Tax=Prunus armeniaca TaxID=36596 RepID=A0A6J5XXJ7_PRUAR|nr:unnamed protein product [Prunus armeniaca]CAB4316475.1 unnamed protein product [Prunus armeniaca]